MAAVTGNPVEVRYAQAVRIAVVVIVAVWHLGYDVLLLTRDQEIYQPLWAAFAAWVVLAVVQVAGSVLLLRSRLSAATARTLAVIAVAAGAMAVAAYPSHQAIGDFSWAWNTVGWFGVLLLLERPIGEFVILLTVNTGVTVIAMALDGSLAEPVMWARLIAVTYATAGIQLAFALLGRQLHQEARRATRTASEQARSLARDAADEAIHAERQRRYGDLQHRVRPLLRGLAGGELDPAAPAVRRAAAIEAGRLRRLFAETDETPHPLLHELRACADVAERRAVQVTLASYGDLPPIPAEMRQALVEASLRVLAEARDQARLTVLADPDEVVVSVVAGVGPDAGFEAPDLLPTAVQFDEEERELWVETTWAVPGGG
ncbi:MULTISPECIES: hypothetical protein [Streptomyces]|uniref:hypothetical protein n=1 Tax=Streptomyces TaxID=1883 RepID=UPI0019072C3C|nr:hypothetical protein [Streptomyces sp. XC 2026]QQN76421.1 hypothetical protein IPZ77_02360 [Streptomyces sp. XC 2026]